MKIYATQQIKKLYFKHGQDFGDNHSPQNTHQVWCKNFVRWDSDSTLKSFVQYLFVKKIVYFLNFFAPQKIKKVLLHTRIESLQRGRGREPPVISFIDTPPSAKKIGKSAIIYLTCGPKMAQRLGKMALFWTKH